MVSLPLNGPGGQTGRSAPGQYVYWICMAHPTQETLVAKPGMKIPADFSRESFTEFVVWARRRKMMAALLCPSAACSQRWGSGAFYRECWAHMPCICIAAFNSVGCTLLPLTLKSLLRIVTNIVLFTTLHTHGCEPRSNFCNTITRPCKPLPNFYNEECGWLFGWLLVI